jgi:hypothetical protein
VENRAQPLLIPFYSWWGDLGKQQIGEGQDQDKIGSTNAVLTPRRFKKSSQNENELPLGAAVGFRLLKRKHKTVTNRQT